MSDVSEMTIEMFETAAAKWGADTAMWPEEDRAAADGLLAASPEARSLRAELMAMEADLALARAEPLGTTGAAPDDLMARVLADAARIAAVRTLEAAAAPSSRRGWRLFERLDGLAPIWRAAGACAASALVGVFVGYMSPAPIAEAATSMASLEMITGDTGAGAGESFELAMTDLEPF
ncbi:MAG: hypothetical protein AAFN79_06160 [Pseudomonadota bacterium]